MHAIPVPRLGGIAIFSAFILTLAGYQIFFGLPEGPNAKTMLAILLPGTLIFVTGLFDDFQSISPTTKVVAQAAAGLAIFITGLGVRPLPFLSSHPLLSLGVSLVLTVSWVLLLSNGFNLIDGLDGLSGGSALIAAGAVFLVSLKSGDICLSVMTAALAGSLLAFLRFNFYPARIFLGDCGSLFLGFTLSALSLTAMQKSRTVVAAVVPVVMFGLPLLDTILAVVRRFLGGQPILAADREHIHHRLMRLGYSHKQTVFVLYGVTTLFSMAALLLLYVKESGIGYVLAAVAVAACAGVQYLRYPALTELVERSRRVLLDRKPIVANVAVRRATEELSSAHDFDAICTILSDAFQANEFDRFDLSFRPGSGPDLVVPAAMRKSYSGAYSFEWQKADRPLMGIPYSQWGFALCGKRFQHATLTVYRGACKDRLLFDINLLMGDFQQALADAIDNALAKLPHEKPIRHHAPPALAAAVVVSYGLREPQPIPAFPH